MATQARAAGIARMPGQRTQSHMQKTGEEFCLSASDLVGHRLSYDRSLACSPLGARIALPIG